MLEWHLSLLDDSVASKMQWQARLLLKLMQVTGSQNTLQYFQVKIRARLSRPRQRGKTARQARGGYVIAHGSSHGSRGPWGSSSSRIDPHESRDRDGRSIQSRGAFDAGINRAYGPRDGNIVSHGVGSGRQFSSPERPYGRRSTGILSLFVIITNLAFFFFFFLSPWLIIVSFWTVQAYGKTSSKRDYIQEDELYSRASDFDKHPIDRHSYRDAYASRGSGYLGSPSRSGSRAAARRSSLAYDDYGYDRYMEQPSNYHDSHISDYSSIPTSKRPHSAIVSDLYENFYTGDAVFPHLVLSKSNPRSFLGGSPSSLC